MVLLEAVAEVVVVMASAAPYGLLVLLRANQSLRERQDKEANTMPRRDRAAHGALGSKRPLEGPQAIMCATATPHLSKRSLRVSS